MYINKCRKENELIEISSMVIGTFDLRAPLLNLKGHF